MSSSRPNLPHQLHRKRVLAAALLGSGLAFLLAIAAILVFVDSSPGTPSDGSHKVTICHATSSATNPFNEISPDVSATGLSGGHYDYNPNNGKYNLHEGDIIPAFTFTDKDDVVHNVPGLNLATMYGTATGQQVLANGCEVPDTPPVDACPNIPGQQSDVPEGYVVDAQGNCVLAPPPVDVCPNLDGDQSEVPSGYTLVDDECVEQSPTDVCPNIDGDQATVPSGMLLDVQGTCVTPPSANDLCPNVEGIQTSLPVGTRQDASGNCVATADSSEGPGPDDSTNPPVDGDDTTTHPVAGEQATAIQPSGELPFTGKGVWLLLVLGVALVIGGSWLELAVRREHARVPADSDHG